MFRTHLLYRGGSHCVHARVQDQAGLYPQSTETYTFYGNANGTWVQIGTQTATVPQSNTTNPQILPAVSVTSGTYSAIKVSASSNASWVGIIELTVSPG